MLVKEFWREVTQELYGVISDETMEKARPVATARLATLVAEEIAKGNIAVIEKIVLGCPNTACPLNVQDSDCDGNFADCQMNAYNYPDNLMDIETPTTRAWIGPHSVMTCEKGE